MPSKGSKLFPKVTLVFFALTLCSQSLASGQKHADYDRLHAVERFLDAIYPQLQQHGGFLTLQTEEFNRTSAAVDFSAPVNLFFVQCWPGSGVPAGGTKTLLPHCNGNVGSVVSDFLHIILETGPAKFPIHRFYAQGKFVEEKQNALLTEIQAHPEWSESEKFDAVKKAGARFGPENKEKFVKSVPADVIYQFSACRLNLGTASFGPDYGWVIQGTRGQGHKQYPCHAGFEPFDGKLIGIDEV